VNPDQVRKRWAERSGEFSPDYYAHRGPDETSDLLASAFEGVVPREAPILEVGCSCGRHLAHLHEQGYSDLHGVEVNDDAFDVMADVYPDLAGSGTFYRGAIEDVVGGFDDDRFAAVFSVETLQHIHPDSAWVFDELARIAAERIVTAEHEGDDARAPDEVGVNYVDEGFPLYYRNWRRVFAERGFEEVDARSLDRDTFRVFRPSGD
jgi:SAM-dependent methyltransferase